IQKDGSVVWNPEILEKYLSSKANQTACMTCRVASLCGSSCRQSLMEFNNTKECIFGLSEEDKDKMVLNHFESRYMNS
ncbi:MAG: hypothetical protein K2H03_00415, partial [Muribaculaceae bacterium]|nr:hypothetical protein [Muribaculaceae bacterium]